MSTLMLAAEFDRPLSRLQFCVIAGIPTRLTTGNRRGRLHEYNFPYESPYDLLQIGWVYDSLYDKKI
jgi:hypothetical protein